jgi:hypothetical protein
LILYSSFYLSSPVKERLVEVVDCAVSSLGEWLTRPCEGPARCDAASGLCWENKLGLGRYISIGEDISLGEASALTNLLRTLSPVVGMGSMEKICGASLIPWKLSSLLGCCDVITTDDVSVRSDSVDIVESGLACLYASRFRRISSWNYSTFFLYSSNCSLCA